MSVDEVYDGVRNEGVEAGHAVEDGHAAEDHPDAKVGHAAEDGHAGVAETLYARGEVAVTGEPVDPPAEIVTIVLPVPAGFMEVPKSSTIFKEGAVTLKTATALIMAQTGVDISTMGLASCHCDNLGGILLRGSQFIIIKNAHKEEKETQEGRQEKAGVIMSNLMRREWEWRGL